MALKGTKFLMVGEAVKENSEKSENISSLMEVY